MREMKEPISGHTGDRLKTAARFPRVAINKAEFPAIVVFYDGSNYWLADGFHGVLGGQKAEIAELQADIRQGDKRNAILYSVGANSDHGLRRTNSDKRRAVMTLLDDAEWRQWGDREISRRCNVSDKTVTSTREEWHRMNPGVSLRNSEVRKVNTKHGTVTTMKTSNIGKRPKAEKQTDYTPSPEPEPTALVIEEQADMVYTPVSQVAARIEAEQSEGVVINTPQQNYPPALHPKALELATLLLNDETEYATADEKKIGYARIIERYLPFS
jgi:hypothetical protein